jgi:hypothetical protein
MFPWPVTMVVICGVMCILVCSLSATSGKYSFVVLPFCDVSHSFCHDSTLLSSRIFLITLFGILLKLNGVCVCVCVHMYVCAYVRVYVCTYVYITDSKAIFPSFEWCNLQFVHTEYNVVCNTTLSFCKLADHDSSSYTFSSFYFVN